MHALVSFMRQGITSACAEKSQLDLEVEALKRNYLRMRGEEADAVVSSRVLMELPPHARRRGSILNSASDMRGITSACAEKSRQRD